MLKIDVRNEKFHAQAQAEMSNSIFNTKFHLSLDRGTHEAQIEGQLRATLDGSDMPVVQIQDLTVFDCCETETTAIDVTAEAQQLIDTVITLSKSAAQFGEKMTDLDSSIGKKIARIKKAFEYEMTQEEKDLENLAKLKEQLSSDEDKNEE